jgi:DNA-binding IclR family transcriptional regulator
MSGVMSRTLAILERLAGDVNGLPLASLADELDIPRSAAHRLLSELVELGWVRQSRDRGDYRLTTKLVSLGLTHLKLSGVPDLCQPIVDRLAAQAGELVRMGVADEDHLTWVVTAQGATSGLRYDPDAGIDARLSCTSSGLAWLSTLTDDEALELVTREGWPRSGEFGTNAPTGPTAFLKMLRAARRQGFAITHETYRAGISSLGVPVSLRGKGTVGVVVISGPSVRLTDERLHTLVPAAQQAADELAQASRVSAWFDRAYRPRVPSAAMLAPAAAPAS